MESEIQQLVEMGATVAQARAALRKSKDVMQAAEMIFSGEFDNVVDDDGGDVRMQEPSSAPASKRVVRPITPDYDENGSDQDMRDDEDDEDDDEAYNDYDSDYEAKINNKAGGNAVDPYAGIFFSKTRKEEVFEVDEDPEYVYNTTLNKKLPILSRNDFMKGCPEASEQTHLFSLYNKLSEPSRKCSQCSTAILITKADFLTIFPSFSQYTENLRTTTIRHCPRCQHELCAACGEGISPTDKKRASHQAPYDPLFHCSDLQGVILGMGLFMIDRVYAQEIYGTDDVESKEGKERAAKKRRVENADDDSMSINIISAPDIIIPGLGRGATGKKKSGIGYDGAVKEDTTGQAEAQAAQSARDARIGILMSHVRVYLPSLQREGGSQTTDYLVSPTALAHLRRRFNTVASSLLRNDSLTDMSERSVLYFELFSWLQTISNHEALASMVAMPIMIPTSSTVVNNGSGSGQRRYRERRVVYEGSAGPRELMESLVIQATAAKKGLEGSKPETLTQTENEEMTEEQKRVTNLTVRNDKGKAKDKNPHAEENAKLLNFCDRILSTARAIDRSLRESKGDAFVERMYSSLPRIPSKAKPTLANDPGSDSMAYSAPEPSAPLLSEDASEEEAQKTYEEWGLTTRFEYCDLSIQPSTEVLEARRRRNEELGVPGEDMPNYKTSYNNDARMLTHSDIPKRNLAIAKELAVLTTNLPVAWNSSIFLRVDETRVDIIKALITGPEGTPYYNGCYLFDIFLGPSYNNSAPSVKYMTTNTGKFRFNPNLYADGKVCLSLLGTWTGPGWVSGKSTLLQVLISIQSMILCEEPYLNEPGWANGSGSPSSAAYSANVRRMVVHTAMLGNIKNPPEPFKDIIHTHFRLKAASITKQLDDWLKLDDGKVLMAHGAGSVPNNGGANQSGGSLGNGFRRDVDELKRVLRMLTRGEDPSITPEAGSSSIATPNATNTPSEAHSYVQALANQELEYE